MKASDGGVASTTEVILARIDHRRSTRMTEEESGSVLKVR